jgi:chemotaxis protein MotA
MFAIIGIVVVFGCIVAGYLMEQGNLRVLIQPAELVIIGGTAIGMVLVANPIHILKEIAGGLGGVFGRSKFTKKTYIETLKMMYDLLNKARKDGLMALEADVEEPQKSPIFSKNLGFLKNHHLCDFDCDFLRMAVTGIDPFELGQMLDLDLEVHHHDATQPTTALSTMADSLPGLGIVAAVLGVVISMGALGGPPEEIGHKVAAALVGTFLGILLCYGLVGPVAANMTKAAEEEHAFLYVMRVLMVSFLKDRLQSWRSKSRAARFPVTSGPRLKNSSKRVEAEGQPPQPRRLQPRSSPRHGQNTPHHHPENRRVATEDITAAPGRWPMLISSRR